jgi:hypothetical protein
MDTHRVTNKCVVVEWCSLPTAWLESPAEMCVWWFKVKEGATGKASATVSINNQKRTDWLDL